MCRIGSQDGGKQTKNPTMCRTGSQAENEKRNDKESTRQRGRGRQCLAQKVQGHMTPHRNHLWDITHHAGNTIYSHMSPPLAWRLLKYEISPETRTPNELRKNGTTLGKQIREPTLPDTWYGRALGEKTDVVSINARVPLLI